MTKEEIIKIKKKDLIKFAVWIGIFIFSIIPSTYLLTNYQFHQKMDVMDSMLNDTQKNFDIYFERLEEGLSTQYRLDAIENRLYLIEELREEILELDKRLFWKLEGTNKLLFDIDETMLKWLWEDLESQRKKN